MLGWQIGAAIAFQKAEAEKLKQADDKIATAEINCPNLTLAVLFHCRAHTPPRHFAVRVAFKNKYRIHVDS